MDKADKQSDNMRWLAEQYLKAKFCRDSCPIPKNERKNYGCLSRPVVYMKECPQLRAYKRKNKQLKGI